MMVNNAAKALILDFLKTPESKDASDAEKKRLKERLENLATELSYAWRNEVFVNLSEKNRLPVGPFRTDAFELQEKNPPKD